MVSARAAGAMPAEPARASMTVARFAAITNFMKHSFLVLSFV
jgi:hypothetical protein